MTPYPHEKFVKKITQADQQQAEAIFASLLRERRFLTSILEAFADGLLVVRANFEILLSNSAAWRLLSISPPHRVVGRKLTDFPLPQELASFLTRFALGEAVEPTLELELGGEEPKWLHVSVQKFEQSEHELHEQLIMVTIRDVTTWYRAEEQRRRAEYWKQMAVLAAGLAHEIKNPLNSLQIHAQLLQRALKQKAKRSKSVETLRQSQSCDIIVEEIARLGKVVNEFLAAVRPSRPLIQRANINYHLERVVETMRPEIEARGVRLKLALDYEIPPVDFDPDQMRQVLLNVLKNALEALDGAHGPLIEVRTQMAGNEYLISITDNGHGISAENLERIRQPFFTTKASGTGLGLSIVSRIVEEHGGRIEIQSDVKRGTTVTLRFPLVSRPRRQLEEHEAGLLPGPCPSANASDDASPK